MSDDRLPEELTTYRYGWHDQDARYLNEPHKGLSEAVVRDISQLHKSEPAWMLERRLKAFRHFQERTMPTWGADLSGIDFEDIFYYLTASARPAASWEDVPAPIKRTFDKLGIPEAEQKFLAGVSGQFDSTVAYHSIRKDLEAKGVIFVDTDTALREHPDLVREHFGTIIPANDNKLAALNTAVWSGGSFVWVPPGVTVDVPLQAYFRINGERAGQFERTLIVAEEGSSVHYTEGCSAPSFSDASLHSAVVEIVVKRGARVRYTTIQNWSSNVYNLVTKRARVEADGVMEWIDANLGCLAEGTRVTTPRGQKRIEDLVPGDKVLAFDEASGQPVFRRVRATKFSGVQPVHEVSVGARRLLATANHPFYSFHYDPDRPRKSGRYRLGYRRVDELQRAIIPASSLEYGLPYELATPELKTAFTTSNQYRGDLRARRDRASRLRLGTGVTTDDLMWLFGAYLGDGSMSATMAKNGGMRHAAVTFSIPRNDRARQRLVRVMKGLMPGTSPSERRDGVTLSWASVEFAQLLLLNGFAGSARDKRVPPWVLDLPESQRVAFIAGYLDTDGCASTKGGFTCKSVCRELLQGMADVLTSIGVVAHIWRGSEAKADVMVVGRPSRASASYVLRFAVDDRVLRQVSPGLRKSARQHYVRSRSFNEVGRSQIKLPASVQLRKVLVSAPVKKVRTWDIEVEGDGNFITEGFVVHNSKITMKYPSIYLVGERAHGEVLSLAVASSGQHQDAGAKIIHAAPNTTSVITSKSVSRGTGRTSYRGLLKVYAGAHGVKSTVRCDALILDPEARSDTYPVMEIDEDNVTIGHEATVSRLGEEQLFYLRSRGLSEEDAAAMIVNGFVEPVVKTLPMDYALELNRLILLQLKGAIG